MPRIPLVMLMFLFQNDQGFDDGFYASECYSVFFQGIFVCRLLKNNPTQSHPDSKQNKTAKDKNIETMHNAVVSDMYKAVYVSRTDIGPGERHQYGVLYHQYQRQQDRCIKQHRGFEQVCIIIRSVL